MLTVLCNISTYIKRPLARFEMDTCNKISTPLDFDHTLIFQDCPDIADLIFSVNTENLYQWTQPDLGFELLLACGIYMSQGKIVVNKLGMLTILLKCCIRMCTTQGILLAPVSTRQNTTDIITKQSTGPHRLTCCLQILRFVICSVRSRRRRGRKRLWPQQECDA